VHLLAILDAPAATRSPASVGGYATFDGLFWNHGGWMAESVPDRRTENSGVFGGIVADGWPAPDSLSGWWQTSGQGAISDAAA
jgi:hypothetical protein